MKIEHIALYVNDLEAAKDFFVRYFDAVPNGGYHNPRTDFRSYFLTFAECPTSRSLPPAPDTRTSRSASAVGRRWMR